MSSRLKSVLRGGPVIGLSLLMLGCGASPAKPVAPTLKVKRQPLTPGAAMMDSKVLALLKRQGIADGYLEEIDSSIRGSFRRLTKIKQTHFNDWNDIAETITVEIGGKSVFLRKDWPHTLTVPRLSTDEKEIWCFASNEEVIEINRFTLTGELTFTTQLRGKSNCKGLIAKQSGLLIVPANRTVIVGYDAVREDVMYVVDGNTGAELGVLHLPDTAFEFLALANHELNLYVGYFGGKLNEYDLSQFRSASLQIEAPNKPQTVGKQ